MEQDVKVALLSVLSPSRNISYIFLIQPKVLFPFLFWGLQLNRFNFFNGCANYVLINHRLIIDYPFHWRLELELL